MESFGNLDLNLLRIFDAVMAERNVTRAARRLYLSQPAVSHALTRLRHVLKDDLFVRVPGGVQPTQKALELSVPIGEALAALEVALTPDDFDPRTSNRVFRIAAHDYFVSAMLAEVAAALTDQAPGVSVRIRPTEGRALEMLDSQDVDLAVSAFGELPERFEERVLLRDRYVCLLRKGHPLARRKLSTTRYAAARHLLISPRGDERGFIDDALAKKGMTRHVAMVVNQFSPVGSIVASSDLVVTLPERIATRHADAFGLKQMECPLEAPDAFTRTSVIWHRRLGSHPALTWFCDVMANVVGSRE
ncbi:MAG: LysR family transcriptional regulator [Pseudomonadota bacterium]